MSQSTLASGRTVADPAGRIRRILVANRGEIAVRVIRAAQAMGVETVAVVSTADRDSLAARMADRAICIGPPPAGQSYLHIPSVLTAALGTGCDAVHPGYGFLSENPDFARQCVEAGLTFIGPSPDVVAQAGDKARAREIAQRAGIPVLTGSPILTGLDQARDAAAGMGFPVLLKAAAGGGGRGMVVVEDERTLQERFASASSEAQSAFGDGRVYLERYIRRARHIEVQVLGDRHGHVIDLGERDCSLQRRHQKVIEEAPAAGLTDDLRAHIRAAGRAFAEAIGLDNAGTVEFILDADTGEFAFLEFNARIQVEHPVTEMVTGVDLVQAQIRSAQGEPLALTQEQVTTTGHAIEVRLTTESPRDGFMPRAGRLTTWEPPEGPGVRMDTHAVPGLVISPYYDSLLAKLVAHGSDRAEATARMVQALLDLRVEGVPTTADFAAYTLRTGDFVAAQVSTMWIAEKGLAGFVASEDLPPTPGDQP